VLRLEWSQVDLAQRAAWIHADQAKARSAIGVPRSQEAVDVVRGQIGKHQTRVFVDERGRTLDKWPTRAQKAWEVEYAQNNVRYAQPPVS
jgi:integrase